MHHPSLAFANIDTMEITTLILLQLREKRFNFSEFKDFTSIFIKINEIHDFDKFKKHRFL